MKVSVIALLASVAIAAPVSDLAEGDTTYLADVCACIGPTGVTDVATCYIKAGNVANYNGKSYCVSAPWAGDYLTRLFTDAWCAEWYPNTPKSSCYKAQVCQGPTIGSWGKFC